MKKIVPTQDDIILIKNQIVNIVNEFNGGIKSTDLVVKVISYAHANLETCEFDFVQILNDCVRDSLITELEYIIPAMTYRLKTMYFPVGTTFNMKS